MPVVDLSSYHQSPATVADATKYSNGLDAIQAALNGLDTTNLIAGAGIKGSQLATGLTGPPGTELAYTELTAPVFATATVEASANTVVTASAVSFDGSTSVVVEFYTDDLTAGTSSIALFLFDGATSLGYLAFSLAAHGPATVKRRLTPSSGSHTYSVRAIVDAGTGRVQAGAGGVGVNMPAFIRITKV